MFLCAGPRQLGNQVISGAVDTYLQNSESSWYDNLGIFTEGKLAVVYFSIPYTWGSQRGVNLDANNKISGAVAGDSTLQDRGVAHYLLPLLF